MADFFHGLQEIPQKIQQISDKNYKDFKKKLTSLLKWFEEHKDLDNIKVLRNKLENLLSEYEQDKKLHKNIKNHLKDLHKFLDQVDEIIHEIEEGKEKLELIDVIKYLCFSACLRSDF